MVTVKNAVLVLTIIVIIGVVVFLVSTPMSSRGDFEEPSYRKLVESSVVDEDAAEKSNDWKVGDSLTATLTVGHLMGNSERERDPPYKSIYTICDEETCVLVEGDADYEYDCNLVVGDIMLETCPMYLTPGHVLNGELVIEYCPWNDEAWPEPKFNEGYTVGGQWLNGEWVEPQIIPAHHERNVWDDYGRYYECFENWSMYDCDEGNAVWGVTAPSTSVGLSGAPECSSNDPRGLWMRVDSPSPPYTLWPDDEPSQYGDYFWCDGRLNGIDVRGCGFFDVNERVG